MVSSQPLPGDLVDALHRVRDLEHTADDLPNRRAAIAAAGMLMAAAAGQGWSVTAMAEVYGIDRQAASKRVQEARKRLDGERPGLAVPAPDRPPLTTREFLSQPAIEREWLTVHEAVDFTGRSEHCIRLWHRKGVLPNTEQRGGRNLFLRADLKRVMSAREYRRGGIDLQGLHDRLHH